MGLMPLSSITDAQPLPQDSLPWPSVDCTSVLNLQLIFLCSRFIKDDTSAEKVLISCNFSNSIHLPYK